MTETQFIEQNKDKWRELEYLLTKKDKDPDKLHDLFVKVSSDLAYASTFYPKRSVRAYLNQLTQQVFDSMEEKKSEWGLDAIKNFFSDVLPREMYQSRKALLASFIIFTIAIIIGVVSSANNPDFLQVILGDDYVRITEENINKGDPMAVYKGHEQSDMFFQITINNVRVSFMCFILGIFGSLGTIIFLLFNGIMLGAFQYFFYEQGLFMESFLTIWIHGAIEISAIIIAGAAGIVLGNGLLFPKTYDRATSLQISAKRGVRIIAGTTPLFFIAGFLESFVTRLTGMPTFLKVLIIAGSFAFILGVYVIYPWWYSRYRVTDVTKEILPEKVAPLEFKQEILRSFNENLNLTFSQFRSHLGQFTKHAITPLTFIVGGSYLIYHYFINEIIDEYSNILTFVNVELPLLMDLQDGGVFLFVVYWLVITYAIMILGMLYRNEELTWHNKMIQLKYNFLNLMLISMIPVSLLFFMEVELALLCFLIIPPQSFIKMMHDAPELGWSVWGKLKRYYIDGFSGWITFLLGFFLIAIFHFLLSALINSSIGGFFFDFISWHELFGSAYVSEVIMTSLIHVLIGLVALPLYYFILVNISFSENARVNALDLWSRFEGFNNQSSIFESKI